MTPVRSLSMGVVDGAADFCQWSKERQHREIMLYLRYVTSIFLMNQTELSKGIQAQAKGDLP